jgi:hypothetical protein
MEDITSLREQVPPNSMVAKTNPQVEQFQFMFMFKSCREVNTSAAQTMHYYIDIQDLSSIHLNLLEYANIGTKRLTFCLSRRHHSENNIMTLAR